MMEWYENESFWSSLFPFMFPEKRFLEAALEVDRVCALTGIVSGNVLDLCCGPGRHSVEFGRRGFSVTGVDRSAFLLDKARALSAEKNVTVEWVEQDMRRFERPEAFDLIVNMFTAFGYFDDRSEDLKVLKVLKNMTASLKPRGKALIDVVGKEIIARVFQPAGWDSLDDGSVLAQHRTVSNDWTRIDNEWILIRGDRAERFPFGHALYSGQELKDRMSQAGFSEVKIYGNLNGDAYDTKASRLVAVGTK